MEKSRHGRSPNLSAIRSEAEKKVQQQASAPTNLELLDKEIQYENDKLEAAEKKEKKKKGQGKSHKEGVVSLLLVFRKTDLESKDAGYKRIRRFLHCACTWKALR